MLLARAYIFTYYALCSYASKTCEVLAVCYCGTLVGGACDGRWALIGRTTIRGPKASHASTSSIQKHVAVNVN